MKINKIFLLIFLILLTGCVGYSSTGVLGTGVSIALDPWTLGTQIDDSVMQQNLRAKIFNRENDFRYLGDEFGYTQGMGLSYQVDFNTFKN